MSSLQCETRAQEEGPGGGGEAMYLEVIIKTIFDDVSPKVSIYLKDGSILSLLTFKTVGHL